MVRFTIMRESRLRFVNLVRSRRLLNCSWMVIVLNLSVLMITAGIWFTSSLVMLYIICSSLFILYQYTPGLDAAARTADPVCLQEIHLTCCTVITDPVLTLQQRCACTLFIYDEPSGIRIKFI